MKMCGQPTTRHAALQPLRTGPHPQNTVLGGPQSRNSNPRLSSPQSRHTDYEIPGPRFTVGVTMCLHRTTDPSFRTNIFTRDTNTCRASGSSRQKSGIQKVTSNRAGDWFRKACTLETLSVTTWYAPATEVTIWHRLAHFVSKPRRSRDTALQKNKQQQNL
jgi:hypothetical protein